MRILRISLADGEVGPYAECTDRQECSAGQFWVQWNSSAMLNWHRTELDRDGNPYTVKWYSHGFRNGAGKWIALTIAMEVDGHHPADTRPRPEASAESPQVHATQAGRLNIGEQLRSPHGTWTVTESWIAEKHGAHGEDRDYQSTFPGGGDSHVYYLLAHADGHEEEWSAPDMADADFHRVLPDQQQIIT